MIRSLKLPKTISYVFLFLFLINSIFAQQKRPNILFVISDDQSFAHTSFAGCTFVKTPAFDRIAKEGCYFSKAYAASPGCAPSRSTVVTGRYPWQNEEAGQHGSSWPKKYIPFLDVIQSSGYYIGRTGKGVDPFQYARNKQDSLRRIENAAGPSTSNIKYDKGVTLPAKGISHTNYAAEFEFFIKNTESKNKPFFFWYGSHEPHRGYEKGSWKRQNKKLSDVVVPSYLPDNEIIRGDLLDYALEIEWFDNHLDKMIAYLKKIGEYDNTIIIVTSDNGMPFPRTKANCYEYGIHVPLAIKFPKNSPLNKKSFEGTVSLTQLAPTILDLTNNSNKAMLPMVSTSLLPQLRGEKKKDDPFFSTRERHFSARYLNWGYPQRAVVWNDYLLIWNMKPERWPAGAPQSFSPKDTTNLLNMYSLDKNGKYTQGEIFADVDKSPSKVFLIEEHSNPEVITFFNLSFDFRPEFELYNVKTDPSCIENLYGKSSYNRNFNDLYALLVKKLITTNDPRLGDKNPEIFDSYPRFMDMRYFLENIISGKS